MPEPVQPPHMELCAADYSATRVRVPDGPILIFIMAQGLHNTGGYEVFFRRSLIDVYPPEFSLWHIKPELAIDVITPFWKSVSFEVAGEVRAVRIHDANGAHTIDVMDIGRISKPILPHVKSHAASIFNGGSLKMARPRIVYISQGNPPICSPDQLPLSKGGPDEVLWQCQPGQNFDFTVLFVNSTPFHGSKFTQANNHSGPPILTPDPGTSVYFKYLVEVGGYVADPGVIISP